MKTTVTTCEPEMFIGSSEMTQLAISVIVASSHTVPPDTADVTNRDMLHLIVLEFHNTCRYKSSKIFYTI